jgi:chromosome segregation ATPase
MKKTISYSSFIKIAKKILSVLDPEAPPTPDAPVRFDGGVEFTPVGRPVAPRTVEELGAGILTPAPLGPPGPVDAGPFVTCMDQLTRFGVQVVGQIRELITTSRADKEAAEARVLEMQERITAITQQKAAVDTRVATLEGDLARASCRAQAFEADLAASREEEGRLSLANTALSERVDSLACDIDRSQVEARAQAERDAAAIRTAQDALVRFTAEKATELGDVTRRLATVEAARDEFEARVGDLTDRNRGLSDDLEAATGLRDTAQGSIAALNTRLNGLRESLALGGEGAADLPGIIGLLEAEVVAKRAEVLTKSGEIDLINGAKRDVEAARDRIQREFDDKNADVARLERELATATTNFGEKSEEARGLVDDLAAKRADVISLRVSRRQTTVEAQQQIDELKAHYLRVKADRNARITEIEDLKRENVVSEKALRSARTSVDQYRTALAAASERKADYKAAYTALFEELQKLYTDINPTGTLAAQFTQLIAQFQQVAASPAVVRRRDGGMAPGPSPLRREVRAEDPLALRRVAQERAAQEAQAKTAEALRTEAATTTARQLMGGRGGGRGGRGRGLGRGRGRG